jgi:hypothetical protein
MTSCLNITVSQRNEGEFDLKRMPLPNRWKPLQRLSRSRNNSISNTMNTGSSKLKHYTLMYDDYGDDDDDSDEVVIHQSTTKWSIESVDNVFVPQWTTNGSMMNAPKGTDDDYSSDDDDDEEDEDERDFNLPNSHECNTTSVTNPSQDNSPRHELMGAFPSQYDTIHDISTTSDISQFVGLREAEEKCGVYILRHDDDDIDTDIYENENSKNHSKYTKSMSDSETEEDTSSSSSTRSFPLSTSFHSDDDTKHRTIRFSDEIAGQSLTTIHLVPWSVHDDMNWIPRPVRCRIEL